MIHVSRPDVAHVTTVHRALDSRVFYREAKSAAGAGLSVIVIGPHDASEVVSGVEVIPIPKLRSKALRRLFTPLQVVRHIARRRPKIVHFHDPEFIPWAFFLKIAGFKVVWDVHEYYSEVQTAHMRPGVVRSAKRRLIKTFVERLPCAIFDRSVFPTKALATAICPDGTGLSCVNLVPLAGISSVESTIHKDFDVVFVGSMSPFRAGPFLEMMAHLLGARPQTKALLLGVPNETRAWMLLNAPSPAVSAAITFNPRVPHDQVYSLIGRAKVGFNYHPMERRFQVALPMKVYEYAACGLPVVCSRFPELADQFTASEMVLVAGDNQADYADCVLSLLEDDDKASAIASAGKRAILERVNWDASEAPKLVDMYCELLGYARLGSEEVSAE